VFCICIVIVELCLIISCYIPIGLLSCSMCISLQLFLAYYNRRLCSVLACGVDVNIVLGWGGAHTNSAEMCPII